MWIKAAQVVLAIGVIGIISGVIAIVHHPGPNDTPTCDGRPMLKTDICIEHFRDGSTERRDYEAMKGHYNAAFAGLMVGAGVVLTAGSGWFLLRSRAPRRPRFEFAPPPGTELTRDQLDQIAQMAQIAANMEAYKAAREAKEAKEAAKAAKAARRKH